MPPPIAKLATTLRKLAYPGEIAEAALAHAIPDKVEAAYRRTDFLEKRLAPMRDWDRYCRGSSG